ncbi:hypothetical protein MMC20_002987 [Loxospora ochrophaea]|nr:hypothetical protein [Loxospora ochrophaea]
MASNVENEIGASKLDNQSGEAEAGVTTDSPEINNEEAKKQKGWFKRSVDPLHKPIPTGSMPEK